MNRKAKIALISGLAISLIIGGIFLFKKKTSPTISDKIPSNYNKIAKDILVGTNDGIVKLYDISSKSQLNSIIFQGAKEMLYFSQQKKEGSKEPILFALDNGSKTLYSIEKENNVLSSNEIYKISEEGKIINFVANNNFLVYEYLSKENKKGGKVINLKTKKVTDLPEFKDVDDKMIAEDSLFFSSGEYIYRMELNTLKIKNIRLGAKTTKLFLMNSNIVGFNEFGKGLNNSILVTIGFNDLLVKNIYKFTNSMISLAYPVFTTSDSLIYFEKLEFEGKSSNVIGKLNTELRKENVAYKGLNIIKDANAQYAKGYIYAKDKEKVLILNINSSNENDSIFINTKCDFYMPIYE